MSNKIDFTKLTSEQRENARKVYRAAVKHGVPPQQAIAQAFAESRLIDPGTNTKGASGVMQVRQIAADEVYNQTGVRLDPSDPEQNAELGVVYMRILGDRFGNDPEAVARAYNAGPTAQSKGNATSDETEDYVDKVRQYGGFGGNYIAPNLMEPEATERPLPEPMEQPRPGWVADRAQAGMYGLGAGAAVGYGASKLGLNNPPVGQTSGRAAQVREEMEKIKDALHRTPYERSQQGTTGEEGTTGRQRQAVYNRATGDEARAIRGQQPVSEFQGRRIQGATPSGIAIPAEEMDRLNAENAAKAEAKAKSDRIAKAQHELKLKEFELARAAKTDKIPMASRLSHIVGKVPVQGLAGAGAGMGIYDAIERYKAGDRSGAVISALQGIGGVMAMIPTVPTRIGGALLEAGAGAVDYFRDNPEDQK